LGIPRRSKSAKVVLGFVDKKDSIQLTADSKAASYRSYGRRQVKWEWRTRNVRS